MAQATTNSQTAEVACGLWPNPKQASKLRPNFFSIFAALSVAVRDAHALTQAGGVGRQGASEGKKSYRIYNFINVD